MPNFTGYDPYSAEAEDIERKRKYADLLRQQSFQPIQPATAGRMTAPIHWTQGAAKMLQGYNAGAADRMASEERRALSERRYSDRQKSLSEALRLGSGQGIGREDAAGNLEEYVPAGKPDLAGAYSRLAMSRDPMLAQMGLQGQFAQMKPTMVPEGGVLLGPNQRPVYENKKDFRPDKPAASQLQVLLSEKAALPPGDPRHAIYDNAIRKSSEVAGQITNIHQPAPITTVRVMEDDPKSPFYGKPVVKDGRTGRTLGLDSGMDVGAQGAKAGAIQGAQAEAKRTFNMSGIGQTIQEAEDLLTGKSGRALPTGSGVGTAVDYVGGLVGVNPEGAKEAQTLKAISGALVAKMPRMEGPQSDKDVMLYKEMAAVVGDSTIPRERRAAALEKVKELWAKYEKPSGARSPEDTAALEWANANPNDPRAAAIKQKLGVR